VPVSFSTPKTDVPKTRCSVSVEADVHIEPRWIGRTRYCPRRSCICLCAFLSDWIALDVSTGTGPESGPAPVPLRILLMINLPSSRRIACRQAVEWVARCNDRRRFQTSKIRIDPTKQNLAPKERNECMYCSLRSIEIDSVQWETFC
jgi:hypothetical protein